MWSGPAPMTRARSTNGRSLRDSVCARRSRAHDAQLVMPTTMTITISVVRMPRTVLPVPMMSLMIGARISASTKVGRTRKKSVIRIRKASSRPPANPPTMPISPPMKTVIAVARKPMTIEMRVPWTVRFSMSRPISSVPSGNASDGDSSRPPDAVTAVWSGPTSSSGMSASTVKTMRMTRPNRPSGRATIRRSRWSAGAAGASGARSTVAAGVVTSALADRGGRRSYRPRGWPGPRRCSTQGRCPGAPGNRGP